MTDSRLRGEWLGSMRFDDLSDAAWRVFTCALMWSNENGTDGRIPARYLRMLHPDGAQPGAHDELVSAELWSATGDGYELTDWEGELGQSSAEYVRAQREGARRRAKEYRDRKRDETEHVTDNVTRDVTENVPGHVGIGQEEVVNQEEIGSSGERDFAKLVRELPDPRRTFDGFWAVWPRKDAKKAARAAWLKAARKLAPDIEVIYDAAVAYAASPHRPARQFVPHAATWLNGERWNDPLPEPPEAERNHQAPGDRARAAIELGRQLENAHQKGIAS